MNVVGVVARGAAAVLTWLARGLAAAAVVIWQRTPRPREIAESLAYSRARRRHAQAVRNPAGPYPAGSYRAGPRHPVFAPLRAGRRPTLLASVLVAGAAVLTAAALLVSQLARPEDVSSAARTSASPPPRHAARAFPVQVGADAAGQPGTRRAAAFVASYFTAVSSGDYPAWASLFLPAAILPPAGQFAVAARHGYQSVTMIRLVVASGTAAVQVTFASRPAAGALRGDSESCVLNFALFEQGRSYLLEALPFGPHGPDANCGL